MDKHASNAVDVSPTQPSFGSNKLDFEKKKNVFNPFTNICSTTISFLY